MVRVSLLPLVLLLASASALAQTTPTRAIGTGIQPSPIITPISSPVGTAAPISNPMPITSVLSRNSDSNDVVSSEYDAGASGCDSTFAAPQECAPMCFETCPERTLRVFGGWNLLENMDVAIGTSAIPAELDFNPGWAIGGAMGKYISCNVRRELEFTYRHNTPAGVQFGGGAFDDDVDGNIQAFSVMGNLVYETPQLRLGQFQPYIGTGIGVGHVDASLPYGADTYTIDDTAVAYQGFVGFQRELGSRAKFFAEYRMFGTDDLDIVGPVVTTRDNYLAHNVLFGLQINR